MRPPTLFIRLLPAYVFVGLAFVFAAGLYSFWTVSTVSRDRSMQQLESQTRLAGYAIEDALRRGAYNEVHAFCQTLGSEFRFHVTVLLSDGTVIGDSNEAVENVDGQANRPEVEAALAYGSGTSSRFDPTTREDMLYHAIAMGAPEASNAVIRVSLPKSALGPATAGFGWALAVAAGVTVLLATAASWWGTNNLRGGIERLERAAERSLDGGGTMVSFKPVEALAALDLSVRNMTRNLWATATESDRQRQQQEAVLGSMVECVLAVDENGRLITLNGAARSLFGIDQSDAEGRPVYEVVRNPELQQLITDTLDRGELIEREFSILMPEPRVVQARGTMLRSEQRDTRGAVVVLHDITWLRRLEEARREFVANVSHELRTPITSIAGFVETLLDGSPIEANHAEHFLQIVMRQTDRLNAIIDDLLTLSRLEQGGLARSGLLAPGDIRTVLCAAQRECSDEAAAKNVYIDVECDDCGPTLIHEELIGQAVTNLVQNAVKYSEPGDRVVLRGFRSADSIVIAVADEGTGIEARHLPRLFERFYRVDRARSRNLGGTGLGLAIVKHIAQAHGGSVNVESRPGEGSTFSLRFPAHFEQEDGASV